MSTNGAFGDEMKDVTLFTDALRVAVPARPDQEFASALVPRLASAARTATIEAETRTMRRATPAERPARRSRSRSRLALVARVGIAVAAIPLVVAGLAVAGVTVPSPARSAFDSVGISLPNQPSRGTDQGSARSSEQTSQPAPQGTSATGAGATPNKGKSEAAHQHALAQHAKRKGKGKAVGHSRGKAVGLNGTTPPGHSGQTGPPTHSNAGGSSGSQSSGQPAHDTHVPKGVAKGHTKVPPGHSK